MIAHKRREDRYSSLRRILTLAEILRQFRFGCRLEFLNRETSERTERPWNIRTTRRDLLFLESCGFIEARPIPGDRRNVSWHWCDSLPMAKQPPERITAPLCG